MTTASVGAPGNRRQGSGAATLKKASKKRAARPKVIASGRCGASFYDEGQVTANGERFDPSAMTAAHKTLPMGSKVRVTNPLNGKSVTVRINDRGPYVSGRCLDLSRAAFAAIGSLGTGAMPVMYAVLAR
ncbi:septal ring lytic transglycosylase RlpA family protein [Sphaerisporangium fuscum]|uniref:septal ring lytic transglycosylase RlpA family protein n=1 Tax=Sphaerisporangium fuscum TaxID=2835868 RepID=UPI0035560B96